MSGVLRVMVTEVPEPGLLRPAVEAALAGRPLPPGPEATVAEAVVARVTAEGRHTGGQTAAAPADAGESEAGAW